MKPDFSASQKRPFSLQCIFQLQPKDHLKTPSSTSLSHERPFGGALSQSHSVLSKGPVHQSHFLPHLLQWPIHQLLHPTAPHMCSSQPEALLPLHGRKSSLHPSKLAFCGKPSLILLFPSFLWPVPVLAPAGQTSHSPLCAVTYLSLYSAFYQNGGDTETEILGWERTTEVT